MEFAERGVVISAITLKTYVLGGEFNRREVSEWSLRRGNKLPGKENMTKIYIK